MSFWHLQHPQGHPAAVDGATGERLSYGDLWARVDRFADRLRQRTKPLVFLLARNTADSLTAYLAVLNAGGAVALINADLAPNLLDRLVAAYEPDWIAGHAPATLPAGYAETGGVGSLSLMRRDRPPAAAPIHPDLAVLLATSGTTGDPKFVRLSHRNLQANAEAIAGYLALTPDDRPITTLPFAYSYGLSVINSHLHAGGTLLLTDDGVMQRTFWDVLAAERATSLAGVPYTYQMLQRLGLDTRDLPCLQTLTQAGGGLDPALTKTFADLAAARNWRFYVMYGQTEATARIAYVPPEQLADKIGSIGIAIPGGALSLDPASQELIYQGPNVMLGYAESRADLARGDELGGRLSTGDLASVDGDGFFRITGRLRRFVKLFGLRINLDQLERDLAAIGDAPVACVGDDSRIRVLVEATGLPAGMERLVASRYRLHPSAVEIDTVAALPRLASGKIDYLALGASMR